jgi:hypothetical protein
MIIKVIKEENVVYIQNRNIKFYHKMGGTGRWYIK